MGFRRWSFRGWSWWNAGVPAVCLAAGLLLAATHGVAGGDEIRRSDAPRLVDLVEDDRGFVWAATQDDERLWASD